MKPCEYEDLHVLSAMQRSKKIACHMHWLFSKILYPQKLLIVLCLPRCVGPTHSNQDYLASHNLRRIRGWRHRLHLINGKEAEDACRTFETHRDEELTPMFSTNLLSHSTFNQGYLGRLESQGCQGRRGTSDTLRQQAQHLAFTAVDCSSLAEDTLRATQTGLRSN